MGDIMQEALDEGVTSEAAASEAVGNLVPGGTYEGVVLDYTSKVVDGDATNPFYGHAVYRVHTELYDCPVGTGKTKHYWFDASPHQVSNEWGLRNESKMAVHLARHTQTFSQPFPKTMEAAQLTRLKFKVRISKAKEGYEPRNWTDAISAVRL